MHYRESEMTRMLDKGGKNKSDTRPYNLKTAGLIAEMAKLAHSCNLGNDPYPSLVKKKNVNVKANI